MRLLSYIFNHNFYITVIIMSTQQLLLLLLQLLLKVLFLQQQLLLLLLPLLNVVPTDVSVHRDLLRGSVWADRASEGLLSRVSPDVAAEVVATAEGLATEGAGTKPYLC